MPAQPGPVADEREGLTCYLAHQRHLVRLAAYGLTDEQAGMAPSASTLCIGGIIKHLGAVERNWMGIVQQKPLEGGLHERMAAHMAKFGWQPGEKLADALADYEAAAAETDAVISGIGDLGQQVPVPRDSPFYPRDVTCWSVRWVLLHLIEETARHAGHADIVRESIDGATAMPLMAAAENWPPNDFIKPWPPATRP